ncbi:MAG TPA: hypothetical protein VF175_00350 [Lacipirellula sp.]
MRRLPLKLAIAAVAIGGGYWVAMTLAPLRPTAVQTSPLIPIQPASNEGAPGVGNDDQVILDMLDTLERRPNIAAKIRQSIRLRQDQVTGEGVFYQQGVGNQRRTRWELTMLVAGERAFVTQVFDGEVVWTDRRLPSTRKVTRVDIGALRRQIVASSAGAGQGAGLAGETMGELLARGGLSQLAAGLHRSFTFGPRQTLQRGNQLIVAVVGQWRPEELERAWPGLAAASLEEWPSHLPHHVLVYVGANDRFPYFIEYRGSDQAALVNTSEAYLPARDAMASFEFIDVQFAAAMPADVFQYTPPDNSWHDITSRLAEEVRPLPGVGPAPEASTAQREGERR